MKVTSIRTPEPATIAFTDAQRRNAIAFLKRVPLKGEEAKALVDLIDLFIPKSEIRIPQSNEHPDTAPETQ